MNTTITQIASYTKDSFTSTLRNGKTVTHNIYTQGSGTKVLILIQELLNMVKVFCMRKQFSVFAKNQSSPIVDFLSDLCTEMKEKHQVRGVAVIGMCLTGNFAISLMANEDVLAGFASQPSLPLKKQGFIHMSDEEVSVVKNRLDQIGPMHCARLQGDKICAAERFEALDKKFNSDRQRIILHQLPGDGHSILTLDFVDQDGHPTKNALQEVMDYFDSQLN